MSEPRYGLDDFNTPWGETFDDLSTAILKDKDAPPVLLLAALRYKHGVRGPLQGLIADAVSLNEQENRE